MAAKTAAERKAESHSQKKRPEVITAKEAIRLLDYNPETGSLRWKMKSGPRGMPGSPAGSKNCRGYLTVKLHGKSYQAHRVIWLIMTGEWPKAVIDHVNGKKDDNRFDNLRDVSHQENMTNQPLPLTNTSGVIGVSWCTRDRKWHAQITADGKRVRIGSFLKFEDAICARRAAEKLYGYHPNHGRQKLKNDAIID